jgi:hypothetical protein
MPNFQLDQLPPEHRAEAARQIADDNERKRPSRGPGKTALPIVQAGKPVERAGHATIGASEKDIQDTMIDLLRLSGWLVLRINGGSMTVGDEDGAKGRYVRFCYWYGPGDEADAGVPDLICSKAGRTMYIEVKRPDKRGNLSPNQQRFQAAAVAVFAEHYVLCGVDELEAVL